MTNQHTTILAALIGAVGTIVGATALPLYHFAFPSKIAIQGAIMRSDAQQSLRSPLEGVEVSYEESGVTQMEKTNQSGWFEIQLGHETKVGDQLTLHLRKHCYQDFNETIGVSDVVYSRYLWPVLDATCKDPTITAIAPKLRNSGTMTVTFQVSNRGSVPCASAPCSPDGKWQATEGTASLDAGEGNSFVGGTAQCVAGPCPFTDIVAGNYPTGGRNISVTAKAWSDGVTFMLQGTLGSNTPQSLSPRTVTFDNFSCEARTNVSRTFDFSSEMPKGSQIVRVLMTRHFSLNQSNIQISFAATTVTLSGWLDAATCVRVPFFTSHVTQRTSWEGVVTPLVAGPTLTPNATLPTLRVSGRNISFEVANKDFPYVQIATTTSDGQKYFDDLGAFQDWSWASCTATGVQGTSPGTQFHCTLNANFNFDLK